MTDYVAGFGDEQQTVHPISFLFQTESNELGREKHPLGVSCSSFKNFIIFYFIFILLKYF